MVAARVAPTSCRDSQLCLGVGRRADRAADRPCAGDRRRPDVRRVDYVLSRRAAEAHRAMVGALGEGHRDLVRVPAGATILQLAAGRVENAAVR